MNEHNKKHTIIGFFIEHVFDILFSIPSIIPIIGWIKCFVLKTEFTNMEIVLSIIIVLNTVIWLIIVRNYYGYPDACRKTQYKTLSKYIEYHRHHDDSLSVSRTINIESNVNGLDRIKDRYLWTGESDAALPKRGQNVSSIHSEESIGIWRYFSINFNQTLNKGNALRIGYKWNKIPNCKTSSPFVSTDTEYETKNIIFDIKLGKEYANRDVILEEFRSIESEVPILSSRCRLDEEGHYRWEINRPIRYRYYRVRWSWIDDDSIEDEG